MIIAENSETAEEPVEEPVAYTVHEHGSECYAATPTVICDLEEHHTHTDNCYETILKCDLPEEEGHIHGEDCYSWYEEYICGLEEGQPEFTAEENRVLICEEPEEVIHEHDASCYEEQISKCTEDHDHTEACEGWSLICEQQEHEHALVCYSNPEADVESASIWERTMERVELTGNYRTDLIAIAKTQLGYAESTSNYIVGDNQSISGYTRYGDWYGHRYGAWCAMFVSFCLDYADVEGMPLDCNCQNWIETLSGESLDLYRTKDIYDPCAGDLIFFDWTGDGLANHVGIVLSLEEKEDGTVLTTLEGNTSNCVKTNTYTIDNESILGYAMLPVHEVVRTADIYTDETYATLSDDTTVITLTGSIPNDAEVWAFPVTVDTEMEVLCAYDIAIFTADGSVYEPDASVNVHIAGPALEITEDSEIEMEVYYIPDEGTPEPMDTSVSEDGVTFDTPHFSTYAVMAVQPRATYVNVSNQNALASNLSSGNSVRLTANISVNSQITIGGNSTVYLDLNGYTITYTKTDTNGSGTDTSMFKIPGGKSMTIQDSLATEETVTATTMNPLMAHATSVSTSNGVVLTYYVTRSELTNAATGATKETVYEHVVTGQGKIKGGAAPIFMVDGTLTLESGMLYGGSQRAILANNVSSPAVINLEGGYICGFDRSSSSAAIYMNPGTLNISGTVIAGNTAGKFGGAINVKWESGKGAPQTTINMTGGVITGNVSFKNGKDTGESGSGHNSDNVAGGGAIRLECSEMNFSGGYITNNKTNATGYWGGGGAIWLELGSELNMSGGYMTSNEADAGGAVKTADLDAGDKFNMTGGFICSNLSRYAEGGGVSIGIDDTGVITGGYINNNHAECHIDWGGGGIFVANGGYLYLRNVLITDNEAGGFGGGVAGCSTARMHISVNEGAAIYDNSADGVHTSGSGSTKNEDWKLALNNPVFMANGYADIFSALNCTVEGAMLGGGTAYWQGTCDGRVVNSTSESDIIRSESMLGLTSHPTTHGIANAQSNAKVFFNGNSSYTHGGAILCNGYMEIGLPEEVIIGARIEVTAKKSVENLTMSDDQFTFVITDSSDNVIATGTNTSAGVITFDGRVPLSQAATHVFYIYEVPGNNASILYDTTKYRMTVVTSRNKITMSGSNSDVYQCKVDSLKVEKWNGQSWQTVNVEYSCEDSANSAIQLDLGAKDATFTNKLRNEPTSITVKKVWADGTTNAPDSITVVLKQNGNIYSQNGTVTLSAANGWTHTWNNLKVKETNWYGQVTATYEYTVEEVVLPGYDVSYSYTSSSNGTEVTITNTMKTYDVQLNKVADDKDETPLEGAIFNVLDSNGTVLTFLRNENGNYELSTSPEAIQNLITNESGKLFLTGLPAGNYVLKETKAPAGYMLADPVTITLPSDDNDTLNEYGVLQVKVVDKVASYTLPETGGTGNFPYTMGGMLLMAAAGLTLLYNHIRRRKEEHASS